MPMGPRFSALTVLLVPQTLYIPIIESEMIHFLHRLFSIPPLRVSLEYWCTQGSRWLSYLL